MLEICTEIHVGLYATCSLLSNFTAVGMCWHFNNISHINVHENLIDF